MGQSGGGGAATHALFLETGRFKPLQAVLERMIASAPDFALSLTTISAYRQPTASIIAQYLGERFGLHSSRTERVQTCLQEAVSNALIHGNLGMESQVESAQEFVAYYEAVETFINWDPYRSRRVQIADWGREDCLEIAVTDEGKGLRPLPGRDSGEPASDPGKSGRGMFLMQSLADRVWIGEDRRALCMRFVY